MDEVRSVLEAFRDATREAGSKRSVACLKRALRLLGVIQSDAVAPGTAPLGPAEAARFDAAFERVLQLSRERIGAPWVSLTPGARP
jgi:dihydrodipicolinate synthase/N-acetylneuraminate lyase